MNNYAKFDDPYDTKLFGQIMDDYEGFRDKPYRNSKHEKDP